MHLFEQDPIEANLDQTDDQINAARLDLGSLAEANLVKALSLGQQRQRPLSAATQFNTNPPFSSSLQHVTT
ncbi:UNVERIFIED_CONTAM: hypothetical protein Slati_3959300 [Sesamum latifolium]|uniref:Uncharacterized protein n=1 Tax=Sesamum latifolium TaxID=2727402 RepID=A0AAW2TPQ8_9LAMI